MEIRINSIDELSAVVNPLLEYVQDGYQLILLSGDMGSGKTTLVKSLCQTLLVQEPVTSPTFSLVNAYDSPSLGVIYHMDLYRLDKPEDLAHIGFEEYLDSGHLCLIEWPDLASSFLHQPYVLVKIRVETDNIRIFNITTHDAVDA
jgi:tRNA threonylcarbamoyladenosine biosynthesis protein TsaE